jgi:hypothetical protein
LEAFANASHVWGHADVADDLLDFYDLWAQRILWSRGRISLSDCQGFIPNAAVQESLLAGRKSQKRFSKL